MDTKEKQRHAAPQKRTASKKRPVSGAVQTPRRASPKPSAGKVPVKKEIPKRIPKRPRPKTAPERQPSPDVVYTEPGLFSKSRLILRLATATAVVLALIFGISIFFKVEVVTVAGCQKYTAAEVKAASGIQEGDNLIGLNKSRVYGNIIGELPYVNKVRVGIKLPNTVKIEIEELDVVYATEADDGAWWLLRADGTAIEKINATDAEQHTKLLGVKITKPEVGQRVVAYQPPTQETLPDGQPVPVTVKAEQQLDTAVSLMQYMEEYGMLGEAASINVENLGDIEIWYGTRFRVDLGDTTDLKIKVSRMRAAINSAEPADTGVLDVTFTVTPGEVTCTPFD